jgi:phosphate starvation-inducible protein PhoH
LYLTEHDVVRHKLVKKIIKAYHDFGESETLKREQAIQEKLK